MGFNIKAYEGKLQTAFKATKSTGKGGLHVGFIAEYDALKGLGHGCGHNLIATMSFAAAMATLSYADAAQLACTVSIVGTPAEETGGGKVIMVDQGCFEDLDFVMMMHPSDKTMVEDFSFANVVKGYRFYGKSAHASAAPWEGKNALEAMLQMLNAINGYRCQFRDYSRINPLIVNGGTATNVIADYARVDLNIRSDDKQYLETLIGIADTCALKSADIYDVTVKSELLSPRYDPVVNCPVLESVMAKCLVELGETIVPKDHRSGVGSTDMGNVTQVLPAIHGHIMLGKGLKTHTAEFRDETVAAAGVRTLQRGAAAMTMTAIEIIRSETLSIEMKKRFSERNLG
jgi:amidohydrolase